MIHRKIFPWAEEEPREPDICLLGIPFDASTTYRPGCRFAPMLVRDASVNMREFNSLLGEELELSLADLGDIVCVPGNVEDTVLQIEAEISDIKDYNDNCVVGAIGGEHSVTYGTAIAQENFEDVTILHFDAHPDLNERVQGELWNHGTVMRRLLDEHPLGLLQVGIRATSKEEYELVKSDERIVQIYAREIYEQGSPSLNLSGDVYVSVDMDVLDPAYAPDVGNPVPCGLNPFELEDILYSLVESDCNIVGFDVVEAGGQVGSPTVVNAAKVVYDMISIIQAKR